MKTQIALILLALVGGSAYAAHAAETPMPVSNDINVTAPHQSGIWSFGAEAVLLQPTNKAFSYANVELVSDDGIVMDAALSSPTVEQTYHGWFGADISYAFPGNGRDVTLAYEGLHGDDSDSTSLTPSEKDSLISTFYPANNSYSTAEGKSDTNYDAADLLFGQKLDVGERISLHPFVGLRYTYLHLQDSAAYAGFNSGNDENVVENADLENTFNGIGPRFGSDAQINLGHGFSVKARLGLSALIGRSHLNYNDTVLYYDALSNELVSGIDIEGNNASTTHVIPEIDGRLGLNYSHDINATMVLGVEAGWQATNYFNVVDDETYSDIAFGEHYSDYANFGLQGPYARVQLDIA